MDEATVLHLLEQTLSPDNTARRAAEAQLRDCTLQPGWPSGLLRIVGTPAYSPALRLSAAHALKRAAASLWHSDEPGFASPYSAEEKALVRSQLIVVTGAVVRETPCANALADAFRAISAHDFPDRWPDLPEALCSGLRSGDPSRTLAALRLLRMIAYHYQMKNIPGGGPMAIMSAATLHIVQGLAAALLGGAGGSGGGVEAPDTAEALRWCFKVYFSVIEHRFTTYPAAHDAQALIAWCGVADGVLNRPPPPPPTSVDPDARAAQPWWRAKKWVARVCARLAERWGKVEDLEEEESGASPAVSIFHKSIAPVITSTVLGQLVSWARGGVSPGVPPAATSPAWLSSRLLLHYFSFLTSASDFSSVWTPLKPHIPTLVHEVTFTLLRPTPEDFETFSTEPEQWVTAQDDLYSSFVDPRVAAASLLAALATKRGKTVLPLIDALVSRTLSGGDDASKDVAFQLLTVLNPHYRKAKGARRAALEPLLTAHVTPALAPTASPMLRVRALRMWGAYTDSKAVSEATKAAGCSALLVCMKDATWLPVRHSAAETLSAFLAASPACVEVVRPHVVGIIAHLFSLLDELGLDGVVTTISMLVEIYKESMPTLAGPIAERICGLFTSLVARAEEDGGDDEAALAADSCLNVLSQLMDALLEGGQRQVIITSILPPLWGLLENVLNPSQESDYLDAALDLAGEAFGVLGEGAGGMVASAPAWHTWVLVQKNIAQHEDWAGGWAYPTDAGIVFGGPRGRFAAPSPAALASGAADYLHELLSCVEAIEANAAETERCVPAKVCVSLLHHARGSVDRGISRIVTCYARGLMSGKTEDYVNASAITLAMAFTYSVPLTLSAIMSVGGAGAGVAGLEGAAAMATASAAASAVLQRFVLVLTGLKKCVDLQIASLALSCIITEAAGGGLPSSLLPLTSLPQLLALGATLLHREDAARAAVAAKSAEARVTEAAEEDEEEEDSAGEGEEVEGGEEDDGSYVDSDEEAGAWMDDEEEDEDKGSSPLDHVNSILFFASAVNTLQASPAWGVVAPALATLPQDNLTLISTVAARASELSARGVAIGALGPGPE